MWIIFGSAAIIFALFNIINYKKKAYIFRFLSMSFTSISVCAFYADGSMRVVIEDWGGLLDTMPAISKALWVFVIISIMINSYLLIKGGRDGENI